MTIDDLMPKICEAAAAAVEGYAKVTGEDAGEDVPESFIQSFVFDQLGKTGVTMTDESNCRKLSDWNNEGRMRRQMPPTDENALAAALRELNRNSRVDLVLFDGGSVKTEHNMIGLVEFKRYWVRYDQSLLDI